MLNELLLLIASVGAVVGVLIVFKRSMYLLVEAMQKQDYKEIDRIQSSFFIRIVFVEVVPLLLVIVVVLQLF